MNERTGGVTENQDQKRFGGKEGTKWWEDKIVKSLELGKIGKEDSGAANNPIATPFCMKITDDAFLTVNSLGKLTSMEAPCSFFHGKKGRRLVPKGYRAELVLHQNLFIRMKVDVKDGRVECGVQLQNSNDELDIWTFAAKTIALVWAKACLSERNYENAVMWSLSGMKAFGLLEEVVLDAFARELKEGKTENLDVRLQCNFWEQIKDRTVWEHMVMARNSEGSEGDKFTYCDENKDPAELQHENRNNLDTDGDPRGAVSPQKDRLRLMDDGYHKRVGKWFQMPSPKKFFDRRPVEGRKLKSLQALMR